MVGYLGMPRRPKGRREASKHLFHPVGAQDRKRVRSGFFHPGVAVSPVLRGGAIVFRGHPILLAGGNHDSKITTPVSGGVPVPVD